MSEEINLFTPYKLRGLEFPNRLGVPPLCQYNATDGYPVSFHLVHYGSYALQGFGLIIQEATAVCPKGRITSRDLGLWDDKFIPDLKEIVDYIHEEKSKFGIQLAHAGRKGSEFPPTKNKRHAVESPDKDGWITDAPSAIAYGDWPVPHELTIEEIKKIVKQFGEAAERAVKIGYDFIEIHGAHGYLISEFLSPLTNHRKDEYGIDKMKFLKEICVEVRKVMPKEMPLFVRLSCSDYKEGGITIDDTLKIAKELHDNYEVDLINASSAGVVPDQKIPPNWDHQLPYAKAIHKNGIPSAAVGGICDAKIANDLIVNDECDLVLIGRGSLRDALLPRHAAVDLGLEIPPYHESYAWATRIPAHSKY